MNKIVSKTTRFPVQFEDLSFHLFMLKNKTKYSAFAKAFTKIIRGAEVLDIGAGTGVLSLMAVALGAKHVVAIERESFSLQLDYFLSAFPSYRRKIDIVSDDFFSVDLRGRRFDLIVSETLGYFGVEEDIVRILREAKRLYAKNSSVLMPYSVSVEMVPVVASLTYESQQNFFSDNICTFLTKQGPKNKIYFDLLNEENDPVFASEWKAFVDSCFDSIVFESAAQLTANISIGNAVNEEWPKVLFKLNETISLKKEDVVFVIFKPRPFMGTYKCSLDVFVNKVKRTSLDFTTDYLIPLSESVSDKDIILRQLIDIVAGLEIEN